MPFKEIPVVPDLVKNEEETLNKWQENGVVEKYLHKNDSSTKRFSFLDGPITANNPMGVHHAHGRTLKDFFQRYKNMQGYKQRFQNGFDCQGLWLEVEEEKAKGFNSKRDIEAYGIEKFCLDCKARVERFSKVQAEQSQRLGMFMDWENSYYTMSEKNNEYIWYFLKRVQDRGMLYKGRASMPWCARCGTAISQHELSDEGWRDIKNLSVFVEFKLKTQNSNLKTKTQNLNLTGDFFFLAWTTTPWTLSSNTALAVKPEFTYVLATGWSEGNIFILGKKAAERLGLKVVQEIKGEDLVGLEYESLYPELPIQHGFEHKVVGWDQVFEEEGTGIVHIAPSAGQEDFELGKEQNLKLIEALDENGIYLAGFGFLTGKSALNVSDLVIDDLKKKDVLFKLQEIVHSYPHCWRCKSPLVFRITSEWFIKVDPIREKLKEEAAKAKWMPEFALKRMLDWLNNMGDWPISRQRYWGLALPFYECSSCNFVTVVESRRELKELAVDPLAVDKLPELHRPWIDEIKIKCPKCGASINRIIEVGDCWLDAGIVPFSTLGYLESRKSWEEWFPAEFITEYMAQIKLWFYSTLFMSVVLEEKAPWQNVLATGFVVDEKGEIMHKTKGNMIEFNEAAGKVGADLMRWMYLSSPASSEASSLKFGYGISDEIKKRFVLILWNSYKFFITYANIDGWDESSSKFKAQISNQAQSSKSKKDEDLSSAAKNSQSVLDRWIFSRLNLTILEIEKSLDSYNTPLATQIIEKLVSDFSTWYIRRSRDRVGPSASDEEDKANFYNTSFVVFDSLFRILSSFMPFLSEWLYQNFKGLDFSSSVHLTEWPMVKPALIDLKLEKMMNLVRLIAEKGHSARREAKIKVRQPLASLIISGLQLKDLEKEAKLLAILQQELNVKEIILKNDGELDPVVGLDTQLTKNLIEEGLVREVMRAVQDERKAQGLGFADHVNLYYSTDDQILSNAIINYSGLVSRNILADVVLEKENPPKEVLIDGKVFKFEITKT